MACAEEPEGEISMNENDIIAMINLLNEDDRVVDDEFIRQAKQVADWLVENGYTTDNSVTETGVTWLNQIEPHENRQKLYEFIQGMTDTVHITRN
jgi:hypothetical protein